MKRRAVVPQYHVMGRDREEDPPMLPSDKIQQYLQDLPASYQAEVLDFVEYHLKVKADRGAVMDVCRDWSNLSPYSAMREMESEESPVCNLSDRRVEDAKRDDGYKKTLVEALSLPADLRMVLVERLLASLNLPIQDEIDRLGGEEAERRVAQVAKGEVGLVAGEEVFTKIRAGRPFPRTLADV